MEGAEEGTQSPPLDGNGGDIEKMSRDLRDMMRMMMEDRQELEARDRAVEKKLELYERQFEMYSQHLSRLENQTKSFSHQPDSHPDPSTNTNISSHLQPLPSVSQSPASHHEPSTHHDPVSSSPSHPHLLTHTSQSPASQSTPQNNQSSSTLSHPQHLLPAPAPTYVLPVQQPRLGQFTGKPPIEKSQVSYKEWREQARQVETDRYLRDPLDYLKRSLRGVASREVQETTSMKELLQKLAALFGDTRSADDLLLDLFSWRQAKQQLASDLLTTMSERLDEVDRLQPMSLQSKNTKLFSAFMKAIYSDDLTRELRAKFGTPGAPGTVAPDFQVFYTHLKYLEADEAGRSRNRRGPTTSSAVHHVSSMTSPDEPPTQHRRKGKGNINCFQCALPGHTRANCPNQFDEDAVRAMFGQDGVMKMRRFLKLQGN